MEKQFDANGHVTKTALSKFAAGELEQSDFAGIAEHVAGCRQCAGLLADVAEEREPVPAGFEEEVMNRISRKKKKQAKLLYFSFRVVLAASLALFIAFSSVIRVLTAPGEPLEKIRAPGFSTVESINTRLHDFSQQLLNLEVFKNAEKTK